MKDRRPLVAGIMSPTNDVAELEKQFVYGNRVETQAEVAVAEPATPTELQVTANVPEDRIARQNLGRVPITTRTRPEVAAALKRASLQRQLAGVEPSYVQDIIEEALEMWLNAKGFI